MVRALLAMSVLLGFGCNTFDNKSDGGGPFGGVTPPQVSSSGFAPRTGFGFPAAGAGASGAPVVAPVAGSAVPVAGSAGARGWQPLDAGPPVVIDDGGVDDAGQ